MRYRLCVLIFYTLITSQLLAQPKLKFSSQIYLGVLEGEANTSFQLQTINGFSYKTLFGGAGTGLDYYTIRSIPLFASINKYFPKARGAYFLSTDIGYNFPWAFRYFSGFETGNYKGGIYWTGGLGYKAHLGKEKNGLLLHIGYSYKHIRSETESTLPCMSPTPCPSYKERYDYRLRRISIKAGWMF
jgi:hypothetical protein